MPNITMINTMHIKKNQMILKEADTANDKINEKCKKI